MAPGGSSANFLAYFFLSWEAVTKISSVDLKICPECGGPMKAVAYIADHQVVDRIIDHLKLTFVAEKPPLARVMEQVTLSAAEAPSKYFL
jgi:hypothetical protein